ncbi:MAG: ankyrin repeat domain-containing protein [Gammaproteobacteria bacterium]|nr:ankyrin repeat domain-containing protein [Gammaproteobacteria bacterium]
MRSGQTIMNNSTGCDEKKNNFDLGDLWSLNPDLTLEDFKNCIINKKSIDHLVKVIKRKMTQQFAIYGRVKKQEGEPSIFYVFFQPSISHEATQEDCKALEQIFKTTIVQADKDMPGIVHSKTKAVCIEEAKITNPALSLFLKDATPEYEVGLSCIFNPECSNVFAFINRSTMNYSSCDLNVSAVQALFFPGMNFDLATQEFYGKVFSQAIRLARSVMPEIEEIIKKSMSLAINQRIKEKYFFDFSEKNWASNDENGRTNTEEFNLFWNNKIRYNKEQFAKHLETTVYIATGLRDEKPSVTWTQLSDTEIVLKTLEIAEENNIVLDLNKKNYSILAKINGVFKPLSQTSTSGATPLMFACRKGPLNLVKSLIEYKVNPFICDDDEHDALWYAKTYNKKDIFKYLQQDVIKPVLAVEQLPRLKSMFLEIKKEYFHSTILSQQNILKDIDNLFNYLESKDAPHNTVTIMLDYIKDRAESAKKSKYFNFFSQNVFSTRLHKLINDYVEHEKLLSERILDLPTHLGRFGSRNGK